MTVNDIPLVEAYETIKQNVEREHPSADIQTSDYYTVVDVARTAGMTLDAFLALPSDERIRIAAHAKVSAMIEYCAVHADKLTPRVSEDDDDEVDSLIA